MSKCKKKPHKWVALVCAHRKKNGRQSFQGKMMIKKQRNLKAIKRTNKRKKLQQLASFCPKSLKDDLI